MFKIMKNYKYVESKSNHSSDKFYVNSAADSECGSDWRLTNVIQKHQANRERSVIQKMPFRIEQGSPPKEVQNSFQKNLERKLAFCFLVVRPGVRAVSLVQAGACLD